MSNPAFDYNGLSIETFDEIYTRLSTGLQAIYGADINLDPDSPDGQRIGILAQMALDLQTYALNLYNQMDCDLAVGDWLNKLIKFAAIFRKPATRSQVDVEVTTSQPVTLPANYAVLDDLSQRWLLLDALAINTGTTTVTLVAENFGAVAADAHTVTDPETVVLGVTGVDNPDAALIGQDEESDETLRVRRSSSTQNPSYSIIGGLVSKLSDLPNVTDAVVYENLSDVYDPVYALNAHTLWAVVEGGDVADITEKLVKQRSGGCGTKGAELGTYVETVTRPDGSTFTITHEMHFDRPTLVPLYIHLTATRTDSLSPIDIALMKQTLSAIHLRIGQNIKASELYAPAYTSGKNFVLSDLVISSNNVTFTDENILSAYDGRFTISDANITITEVV